MEYTHHYDSPLGGITMTSDGTALTGLRFDGQKHSGCALSAGQADLCLPVFVETDRWLDLYFSGRAPDFTPALRLKATPFREAVWKTILRIPYGRTMTYGQVAEKAAEELGIPRVSARAVGGAAGHNAVLLIIPCHRVVGTDGSLTGYAGGMDKKEKLLRMEGAAIRE